MDKNSILVFDRPITLKDENKSECMTYGYAYNSTVCYADEYDYARYLVGLEKWFSMGNYANPDNTWIDSKTGIVYEDTDDYIKEFCWNAFDDNPVNFFYKNNIQITLPEECFDGSFIVKENHWKEAMNMILDINVAEQKAKREQIENNNDEDDGLPF